MIKKPDIKVLPTRRYRGIVIPYFLPGILIFFVSHGYSRYGDYVAIFDLILFLVVCFGVTLVILCLTYLAFRSLQRAAYFTAFLVSGYLFFGDIKSTIGFFAVLDRFSLVFLMLIVTSICLYKYLKFTSTSLERLTNYLNMLFAILILFDFAVIIYHKLQPVKQSKSQSEVVRASPDTYRPDIFLIIVDEYSGSVALASQFRYDNSGFIASLRAKSFFVADSSISNYTSTPVSMASLFQMDYVPWARQGKPVTLEDYSEAEKTLSASALLLFLDSKGYQFYNHSIFSIGRHSSEFDPGLLPTNLQLITSTTLGNQFKKNILATLEAKAGTRYQWVANIVQDRYRSGNQKLVDLTLKVALTESDNPKFVYTHVFMPHWPYLYDSSGHKIAYNAFQPMSREIDMQAYLGYLKFTNTYILDVIDKIMKATKNKAVVMLVSDHGYRKFNSSSPGMSNWNVNATYLPDKNYKYFYHKLSNVNQMRIILNSVFETNLNLKSDSIVF